MPLPVVAIIGRQNVGKSSLFNAIAGRRVTITAPIPGVTRDRVSTIISCDDFAFELYDTGGYGFSTKDQGEASLAKDIQQQIEFAVNSADVILFVVDVKDGLTPLDKELANKIRSLSKKILLVVNKVDTNREELNTYEFYKLGYDEVIPVSAIHKRNIEMVLDKIKAFLSKSCSEKITASRHAVKIAIIGRMNAGKSTLVNKILGQQRVIVSPMPGTTRDSVDIWFEKDNQNYILIDTAGLRKRQKVKDPVEFYGRTRVIDSIKRSDVVILLIEANRPVGEVEKKMSQEVVSFKKPCILALNKWDLVPQTHHPEEFNKYLYKSLQGLSHAPLIFISAKTGFNVDLLLSLARDLYIKASQMIPQERMEKSLKEVVRQYPPPMKGKIHPKILHIEQTGIRPPVFVCYVNNKKAFTRDYIRSFGRRLACSLGLDEVPVVVKLRDKANLKL